MLRVSQRELHVVELEKDKNRVHATVITNGLVCGARGPIIIIWPLLVLFKIPG